MRRALTIALFAVTPFSEVIRNLKVVVAGPAFMSLLAREALFIPLITAMVWPEPKFSVAAADLAFYNRDMRFVVEPGEFRIFASTSSVGGLEAGFRVVEE